MAKCRSAAAPSLAYPYELGSKLLLNLRRVFRVWSLRGFWALGLAPRNDHKCLQFADCWAEVRQELCKSEVARGCARTGCRSHQASYTVPTPFHRWARERACLSLEYPVAARSEMYCHKDPFRGAKGLLRPPTYG